MFLTGSHVFLTGSHVFQQVLHVKLECRDSFEVYSKSKIMLAHIQNRYVIIESVTNIVTVVRADASQ